MNTRDDLVAPRTAWPTLGTLVLCVAAWSAAALAAATGALGLPAAAAACTAAAFFGFTPMHDAAHRSVARARWVNEVVGRLAALLLAGPFPAFRYVHLEHHRHTNEPGLDPDHWSGRGPVLALPLRWLTQDLHYYAVIGARWRTRPVVERVETVLTLAAVAAAVGIAARAGHLGLVLACWIVPARLALALLAFSFDYLPHRPHRVPARVDPYRATHVLAEPLLTPLFLYQNYHLVHHLYPGIPFYRYARVWAAQREALLGRGAREWRFRP